jgi:O-antigen/teichoic acid export membrane protein
LKIPSLTRISGLQLYQVLRFSGMFFSAVILAKIIGDQKVISIYESLMLISASTAYFWVTGSINAFIPYYHSRDEAEKPGIIFNVFVFLSLIAVVYVLALWATGGFIFHGEKPIYSYFLIYALFNGPSFLVEYVLLLQHRPRQLALYGIATAIIQLSCIGLPLLLGYTITECILALAVFNMLKYVLLCMLVFSNKTARLDQKVIKAFAIKSYPLMITLLFGGSMPYIDSYLVKYFFKDQFVIYQYGAREMPLVFLMANALSNVLSGDIADMQFRSELHVGFQKIKSSSTRLMHFLFPLTIVLILVSKPLFRLFYTPYFVPAAYIFNIYMLLSISRLVFPQTIMLGLQKNQALFRISLIEWTINLFMDLVLMQYWGIEGIAFATVIAFFAEKLINMAYLKRLGYRVGDYVPLRAWSLYSAATIIVFVLVQNLI